MLFCTNSLPPTLSPALFFFSVSVFHDPPLLCYFLLRPTLFSHLSPSSSLFASVKLCDLLPPPPPPFPNSLLAFFFPFKIYFLFLRINCTVLYSGINSWNTVTVNNLLSVWEKASAAPICRGLESSLPVVGHLVFTEKLFRRAWISLICFPERVGSTKRELVTYTVVSKQSIYSWVLACIISIMLF